MKSKILSVVLLILVASLFSGCIGKKPAVTEPSAPGVTEAPAEDLEGQFPDVSATTGDEISIEEPDLEAEESVDLGEIL